MIVFQTEQAKRHFAILGISRWALAHGFRREPDGNACRLI